MHVLPEFFSSRGNDWAFKLFKLCLSTQYGVILLALKKYGRNTYSCLAHQDLIQPVTGWQGIVTLWEYSKGFFGVKC